MTESEDQILVRRALHANPASFNELCQRYYNSLIAVADSILLDKHLAEDAAQESLAEACRQLDKLKKPELFGSWVCAICRNVANDMLRKILREQKFANANSANRKDFIEDDQKMILTEALKQLPQHLREVVFLRFYNERSYQQMSEILGLTEQAIDGRLRRAKKNIADFLERKGFRR